MNEYDIVYSEQAMNDVDNLFKFIKIECHSPITDKKYIDGILKTISIILKQPTSFPLFDSKLTQLHGFDVRKINYKKVTIIYSVYRQLIYKHRIMASSLIY